MCNKILRIFLICTLVFTVNTGVLWANKSSPPTVEQLMQQLETLRAEVIQIKKTADEAREIAVASRLESAKFKEDVLYRLGLWRGKLGEGLLMSIAAKGSAEQAEQVARKANQRVDVIWGKVADAEKRLGLMSSRLKEVAQINQEVQKRVDVMEQRVDSFAQEMSAFKRDLDNLATDVSLAKEMAATAKIEATQARKETRALAEECRRTKELLLKKVEEILQKAGKWEKEVKPKLTTIKPPRKVTYYQVKKGESLWLIAKKVYNDPSAWKKIFEANKDKLTSPDLLYPGLRLIIPQE